MHFDFSSCQIVRACPGLSGSRSVSIRWFFRIPVAVRGAVVARGGACPPAVDDVHDRRARGLERAELFASVATGSGEVLDLVRGQAVDVRPTLAAERLREAQVTEVVVEGTVLHHEE